MSCLCNLQSSSYFIKIFFRNSKSPPDAKSHMMARQIAIFWLRIWIKKGATSKDYLLGLFLSKYEVWQKWQIYKFSDGLIDYLLCLVLYWYDLIFYWNFKWSTERNNLCTFIEKSYIVKGNRLNTILCCLLNHHK